MFRRALLLVVSVIFIASLSGCATARKQKDMEIQNLKNQVSLLESQIQSKDEEINSLRDSMNQISEEKETQAKKQTSAKKGILEVKSRPKVKQIQTALRNAGYDPGAVDGKMGRQTKDAVMAFQRANNLPADGIVGKKTWLLLREYLTKKVK